jgi:hypothetical protein
VKLFQIEEPEGGPTDPSAPGAAIGIDAGGAEAQVAFSVGGNPVVLADREGFEQILPVPAAAVKTEWQELLKAAKVRAERALARPVTHAVLVLADAPEANIVGGLHDAAGGAGLALLRIVARTELPAGSDPVLEAAVLAEDSAPRTV